MVSSCLSPPISNVTVFAALAVLLATASVADPIGSVQVYLTPDEALAKVHPGSRLERQTVALSADLQKALDQRAGRPFAGDSVSVYIARDSTDSVTGYAVIGDQIGKYRPITYIVAADTAFRTTGVAILVYRESRGGEVRRKRFLRQYRGKDSGDPVRINRDIVNITGATMSVRALNAGVRASLLLFEELYRPPTDER